MQLNFRQVLPNLLDRFLANQLATDSFRSLATSIIHISSHQQSFLPCYPRQNRQFTNSRVYCVIVSLSVSSRMMLAACLNRQKALTVWRQRNQMTSSDRLPFKPLFNVRLTLLSLWTLCITFVRGKAIVVFVWNRVRFKCAVDKGLLCPFLTTG